MTEKKQKPASRATKKPAAAKTPVKQASAAKTPVKQPVKPEVPLSRREARKATAASAAPAASDLHLSGEQVPTTIAELKALHTTEVTIPLSTGEVEVVTEVEEVTYVESSVSEYELDQVPTRRGRQRGDVSSVPESVAMLTPDRVLEPYRKSQRPEGWPNNVIYGITFGLVDRGDNAKVRHRKAINESIARHFDGGARFVPVLTRKGGVGKTTTTTLLGMALARVRDDRVIAIDANPDRGTLAERFPKTTDKTVRDVVAQAASIQSFTDFTAYISRDKNRLDVLASDTDPLLSEAFDENDYNVVADIVSKYYSVVLTDCGTGIVHSVMKATLERANGLVIVSGGSFDEARLAAETLTWLESNGYADLVRKSVVSINTATQGTNIVNLKEIENHFRSRVRAIVRMPYDPMLAAGSVVDWDRLKPHTREAARELAALVMDGID